MIDFNRLVDKHIEREHRPKQIGRYYPSEIGSCLRKLFYSYKYPMKVDKELLKIFELGNIMHGFVVEVMKSVKQNEVELLKSEMPFKIERDDFVISGRVDDLILVKSDGKSVLVEVKSHKNIESVNKASSNHVAQLMFYMYATGVHDGVVLYVDKNTLQSKVFEIPFDEHKSAEISDKFSFLHKSLVKDELPEAEAKTVKDMTWMCRFCEYRDKCNKNEK